MPQTFATRGNNKSPQNPSHRMTPSKGLISENLSPTESTSRILEDFPQRRCHLSSGLTTGFISPTTPGPPAWVCLSDYYKSKDRNSSSLVDYSTIPNKLLWNLDPTKYQFNFDSPVEQRTTKTPKLFSQAEINILPTEFLISPSGVLLKQQSRDPRWKHFEQSLRQNYTSTTFITYAYKIHMTQISFYFENIITQCIHHDIAYN